MEEQAFTNPELRNDKRRKTTVLSGTLFTGESIADDDVYSHAEDKPNDTRGICRHDVRLKINHSETDNSEFSKHGRPSIYDQDYEM